jgi:hypothetical protein
MISAEPAPNTTSLAETSTIRGGMARGATKGQGIRRSTPRQQRGGRHPPDRTH